MKHYEVRYTDQVERNDTKLGPRTWTRNCEAHVATTSVERAIELVKERVPDAVIVSVQCRNAHMALIVDGRADPQVNGGES
jgi:hypothetical protein